MCGAAEAFYGRALAYERGFDGVEPLVPALTRNVFAVMDVTPPGAVRLAADVRAAEACRSAQSGDAVAATELHFPHPGTICEGGYATETP